MRGFARIYFTLRAFENVATNREAAFSMIGDTQRAAGSSPPHVARKTCPTISGINARTTPSSLAILRSPRALLLRGWVESDRA
jgi:hypothetical protein